jgi:hypothetical protein
MGRPFIAISVWLLVADRNTKGCDKTKENFVRVARQN